MGLVDPKRSNKTKFLIARVLKFSIFIVHLGKRKMYCQDVRTYRSLSIPESLVTVEGFKGCRGLSMAVKDCQGLSRTVMGCLELLWTVVGCRGLPLAVGNGQELLSDVKGCHGLSKAVNSCQGLWKTV